MLRSDSVSSVVSGGNPSVTPATEIRLFDIHGAVAYLKQIGCDAATVNFLRSLITRSQVPHLKIGKKFYITRAALDQWLSRQEGRRR